MQTSQSFVLLVVIPRPTRYRPSFTKRGVFRPKIKILQRFKQDHWKKMPATKRVGRVWATKAISNRTGQSESSIILSRFTRYVTSTGRRSNTNAVSVYFFTCNFLLHEKLSTLFSIDECWNRKSFLCERAISPSVIEENKSRNALAELLDAKFGTGLTAIKASNFNTADRHKRSRVLRNLFLNKYKNPKQLHTQTRINFVFFVASR